jgi:hypothetical protein
LEQISVLETNRDISAGDFTIIFTSAKVIATSVIKDKKSEFNLPKEILVQKYFDEERFE